eukprot:TRINITY_DN22260_c0_g1_i1.p1 TRINITY_DN22260_c0_g1~~TRINITY_DN22260_c0_g1_i1.p1  ORF type:complete len:270 (+),score=91.51 TRINITY_DN22260_c0_g1_i1:74-883(+)
MAPPGHDPHLKMKIFGSMGISSVLLLCALAYNMGKSNLDDRRAKAKLSEDHLNQVTSSLRKRIKSCRSDLLSVGAGHASQVDVEARLKEEAAQLQDESALLQKSNNDLLETLVECESEVDKPRDSEHIDTAKAIEQMQFENHQLQQAHAEAKEERDGLMAKSRRYIDALRVENHILRKRLAKRNERAVNEDIEEQVEAEVEVEAGDEDADVAESKARRGKRGRREDVEDGDDRSRAAARRAMKLLKEAEGEGAEHIDPKRIQELLERLQ